MKNKPMSLLLSPPSYLSFFFPTACWKYLILTGLSFLHDVEKKQKICLLLLVFSMSMTCLLALFWRGIEELSKKNAG